MKGNVVGTVTRVRDRRTAVRIAADANEFSLLQNAEISSWPHPASYSVGIGDSFPPTLKSPGRQDDHLPTSTAEVPNECSSTSAIPVCVYGAYRDGFTFI